MMEPATCMAALCIEPWSLLQVAAREGSKSFERKENHLASLCCPQTGAA